MPQYRKSHVNKVTALAHVSAQGCLMPCVLLVTETVNEVGRN